MAEVLGLGLTHYPPLAGSDQAMAGILRWTLDDPAIPDDYRDGRGWPPELRIEYGDDGGTASAARHRAALLAGFTRVRAALEAFEPDVVVIWGDDQYENFREDIIPPFCVLAYDQFEVRPWDGTFVGTDNVWREPSDTVWSLSGDRGFAKALTSALLADGCDVAYAYRPLHERGLPHAFLNTIVYLDHERRGFPWPIVPFSVNCYGRRVIVQRGGASRFADEPDEASFDPPSPSPRRCMEVGRSVARFCAASSARVALIASSSWSHAFLTDKHWRLYPDVEADRRMFRHLAAGEYDAWERMSLAAIEESGQHEMLNWHCLVGAMEELGRTPTWCDLVETYAFNSNKCFAVFEP